MWTAYRLLVDPGTQTSYELRSGETGYAGYDTCLHDLTARGLSLGRGLFRCSSYPTPSLLLAAHPAPAICA